jgi:hypothetical protein
MKKSKGGPQILSLSSSYSCHAALLLALCVASISAGCAAGYRVETSVDARGVEIVCTVDNEIGLEGEGEYSSYAMYESEMFLSGVEHHCYLDASRRLYPDGQTTYLLRLSYYGPRYLNIQNRRSLKLVIDQHTSTTLEGWGEIVREEDKMNKSFHESFDYLIPVDYLVTLSRANEVLVTVDGIDFELTGFLTDANFDIFRKFVAEYVDWND